MKYILPILIIAVLIVDCDRKEKLHGLWIAKYTLDKVLEEDYRSDVTSNLFDFDQDSLTIKFFPDDYSVDFHGTSTSAYSLKEEMLITHYEDEVDSAYHQLFPDSLVFTYSRDYPNKHLRHRVYQRLKEYGLASQENLVSEMLLSRSFELDAAKIEFHEDGTFFMAGFSDHYSGGKSWVLDRYKNELFLVFEGSSGFVMHITDISDQEILGVVYGQLNQKISLKQLPQHQTFDINQLAGNWVEHIPEGFPSPPSPPLPLTIEEEIDFPEKERLTFTDRMIFKSKWYRTDSLQWKPSREGDWLIFPHLYGRRSSSWQIVHLDEQRLDIRRKVKRGIFSYKDDYVEEKSYIRE